MLQLNIDTLVYGCTHYRHLEPLFRQILPPSVCLIDPARYVVSAAEKELELLGLKSTLPSLPTRFCVSGNPETFAVLSRQWLGYIPRVHKIFLPVATTASVPLEVLE